MIDKIEKQLKKLHQESLFHQISPRWQDLTQEEKKHLYTQILSLDASLLSFQKELLKKKPQVPVFKPFEDYHYPNKEDQKIGEALIQEGKVGCLLLAGGQGTRLGFRGPKGCFPIMPPKTLFHLFAEKVRKSQEKYGRVLPIAIMTSSHNDLETRSFFEKNDFLGLEKEQVDFFVQEDLPFLDEGGNLFLDAPHSLAQGPDGNGHALKLFHKHLGEKWSSLGISHLNCVLIDNPLADPFDPKLIGHHVKKKNDVTLKCIEREDPLESVGVIVSVNGQPSVIEYTELPLDERVKNDKGKLLHPLANISLFALSLEFIQQVASQVLPLHLAHKAIPYFKDGKRHQPHQPMAWKFERFIFDALPFSKKATALVYPRKETFAPLKNLTGPYGVEAMREILFKKPCDGFRDS